MFVSAVTLAALATLTWAEDASTPCPRYTTTTITVNDRPSTSWVGEEVTETGKTRNLPYTETVANYTSTATATHTPETSTVIITTGTSTVLNATATDFTNSCTSTSTVSIEYTNTQYTGTFTSSSLRQTCVPAPTTAYFYELGTVSLTKTTVTYSYRTVTEYNPTVSTSWLSGLVETPTTTVSTDSLVQSAGTTTLPRHIDCYPSETTGTASTTTTQDARCAPSNLVAVGLTIDGPSGPSKKGHADSPSPRDASECCQQCVDAGNCAASYWVELIGSPDGICKIYNSESESEDAEECGWGLTVTSLDERTSGDAKVGAAGCGYIAEQSNSWRD